MTQLPLLTDHDDDDHPHAHNLYDAPKTRGMQQKEWDDLGQQLAAQIREGIARKRDFEAQQLRALYGAFDEDTEEIRVPVRYRLRNVWRRIKAWFVHVPPHDEDTQPCSTSEIAMVRDEVE